MREFLQMGGYAFYVWTSYAVAAVALIANIVVPLRQHRRLLARIARRARRRSAGE